MNVGFQTRILPIYIYIYIHIYISVSADFFRCDVSVELYNELKISWFNEKASGCYELVISH